MFTASIELQAVDHGGTAFPIRRYRLRDHQELSESLCEAAYDERRKDATGVHYGDNGWHSVDALHTDTRYAPLIAVFDAAIAAQWESVGWSRETHPWTPSALWANISPPGAHTPEHAHWGHAGSLFGAVYYASVPPASGSFRARSKDLHCSSIGGCELSEFIPFEVAYWTEFEPRAGDLIVFPNWLWHSVSPNRSEHDRIAWTVLYQLSRPIGKTRGAAWQTSDAHPRWRQIVAQDSAPPSTARGV